MGRKDSDGLRHVSFFKGKRYAIIYDDSAWMGETMTRERMLHLLSGEITTTSKIKHSRILVPKNTCRALILNYSLYSMTQFANKEKETKSATTCFNRRLHKIELKDLKLYLKNKKRNL